MRLRRARHAPGRQISALAPRARRNDQVDREAGAPDPRGVVSPRRRRPVVIRQLSRQEYDSTVLGLLGLDLHLAKGHSSG